MKLRFKGRLKPVKIEEPQDRLELYLVEQAPHLLNPGQMDAVVTTILLLKTANFRVWNTARKSILAGACRIDAMLVSDLYRACPPRLKPAFASASAMAYLAPQDFHPIFEDAYTRQMSAIERRDLALTLDVFLMHNPGERARYRGVVLELLRSRQQEPCLKGITLASIFDDLALEDLRILERKLSVRLFPHRQGALFSFYRLMKRHRSIAPHVLGFCTSERLIARIRQMRRADPDPDVRLYARQALEAYGKLPRARRARQSRRASG